MATNSSAKQLSEDETDYIVAHIGTEWRQLGKRLGLTRIQTAEIEQKPGTFKEKVELTMDMWISNKGAEATKDDMIRALEKLPRRDIIDHLRTQCDNSTHLIPPPRPRGFQLDNASSLLQSDFLSGNAESDFYPFHRGYCIIINNETFRSLAPRQGSQTDEVALRKTFEEFNFNVDVHNDLSTSEMMNLFRKFRSESFNSYDCFVCCVLSHGNEGTVYGSDERQLSIEDDVVRSFTGDKCQPFNGKPKLFFVQACQGDRGQPGVCQIQRDSGTTRGRILKQAGTIQRDADITERTPILADYLLYIATVSGFAAFRNTSKGSYFIQNLTKGLQQKGDRCDIVQVLTESNKAVAERHFEQEGETVLQMPVYTSTLRKQLKFKRCQPQSTR